MRKLVVFAAVALLTMTMRAGAEDVTLKLVAFDDGSHRYYHDLLTQALAAEGHRLTILPQKDYPQTRILLMLSNGELPLHWFVHNPEKDAAYVPVRTGLTNGLIGNRILFIPKGTQGRFDGIRTLEDFRKSGKVNGVGSTWFDRAVWETNGLPFLAVDGDWKVLFKMLSSESSRLDCFARGANEISLESENYPGLDIEKRLVFVYDRDFWLYLSKTESGLLPILEKAMQRAERSGLIDRLLGKYFPEVYARDKLNLRGRTVITLTTPD